MNIKQYIDNFEEIAHHSRDKQFTLLERAHDEIVANSILSPFTLVAYVFPMIFISCLFLGGYLLFGYSIGVAMGAIIVGLVFSRVAVNETHIKLLKKGLKTTAEQ